MERERHDKERNRQERYQGPEPEAERTEPGKIPRKVADIAQSQCMVRDTSYVERAYGRKLPGEDDGQAHQAAHGKEGGSAAQT